MKRRGDEANSPRGADLRLVGAKLLALLAILMCLPRADAAVLSKVQSGYTTLETTITSTVINLASLTGSGASYCYNANCGAIADTSKAFLVITGRGASTTLERNMIAGKISSASTLTFERSGSGSTYFINWYVAEFSSGVSAQRGSLSWPAGATTTTVDITDVSTASSFPLISYRLLGAAYDPNDVIRSSLANAGADLVLSAYSAPPSSVVMNWEVVTFSGGAAVTHGTSTLSAGTSTNTVSATCSDVTKCWLLHSLQTNALSSDSIARKAVRGRVSTNQVIFDRTSTLNEVTVGYHLVDFSDGTSVRHDSSSFASSTGTVTATFSPAVDRTKALATLGGWMWGGRTTDTGTSIESSMAGAEIQSSTSLLISRGGNNGVTDFGWFVVEFNSTAEMNSAVKMAAMEADASPSGVQVRWRTGYELDNVGFHLFREKEGRRVQVTSSLIGGSTMLAGKGVALTAGRSYEFWDRPGHRDARYWIQAFDLDGKSTWHGPIQPRKRPGVVASALREDVSSPSGKRAEWIWPAFAATTLAPDAQAQFGLAERASLRLRVRTPGWQRVNGAALMAAGLRGDVDPRQLRLFTDGHEQAIHLPGGDDGRLDDGDTLEFFAAPDERERIFYLTVGPTSGRRIARAASPEGAATGPATFLATAERRDRQTFLATLKNGDAENLFGPVLRGQPLSYPITLQHPAAAGDAMLEVRLQGASAEPHQVGVALAGQQLGLVAFDALEPGVARFQVPADLLRHGENEITLTPGPDASMVDRIRLTYPRFYRAVDGELTFTAPAGSEVEVADLSSGAVQVFDVTEPAAPLLISVRPGRDAGHVRLTVPVGLFDRLLVATARGRSAAGIERNEPSLWHDTVVEADLILIGPRALLNAAGALVNARRAQGLRVESVEVQDVYDEFSFGRKDPAAIRTFLQRAHQRGGGGRAVLLVGDATFDPDDHLGAGGDVVPTKLVPTQHMETASDGWFVDFDDDGAPELPIGRLPVRTVGETSRVVQKILAGGSGRRRALSATFISDFDKELAFGDISDVVQAAIPADVQTQALSQGELVLDPARAIRGAFERGPALIHYTGHGSVNSWADDLLTPVGVDDLPTTDESPVVAAMTCLNGFFHDVEGRSMAEALLLAQGRGGLGVFASSGLTRPVGQKALGATLVRGLMREGRSLGEALRLAQAASNDPDVRRTWMLFGDPTVVLVPRATTAASPQPVAPPAARSPGRGCGIGGNGGGTALISLLALLALLLLHRRRRAM